MLGALLYLRLTSLANAVLFRIRRLRQPKYLVGTVVAVLYIYYVLLRRFTSPAFQQANDAGLADVGIIMAGCLCVGGSLLALIRIAFTWLAPKASPGLRFSEAEIAFLFPAPVTRRTLIHFRLASSQLAILFTSFLIVFFLRRFSGTSGSRIFQTVGWWVILSTLDMHLAGTDLTLAWLRQRGARERLWRFAAVAGILAYVVAVVWLSGRFLGSPAATHKLAGFSSGPHAFVETFQALLASSPLRWLTLPFRLIFAPYFATSLGGFASAMLPALALMALHYAWLARSQARFEEGSISMAEKRTALRQAMLRGEMPGSAASRQKPLPGPFPLPPSGAPEVAFLWKNILSMRASLLNRRIVLLGLWLLVVAAVISRPILQANANSSGGGLYGPIIVTMSMVVAIYTLLAGPQAARQDLRSDLPNMDILKTYPIAGWRIALGELLAPTALLTLALWVCIIAFCYAADSAGRLEWLTPAVRVTGALCLGAAAPVLCLLQLLVPNTLMVLMPGWYQASRSRGAGIENMGQRLILGVGQLLLALLVGAPAALAATLVIFSSQWILGAIPAMLMALAAVLCILLSEAVVGLWWIGGRIERFDLSTEPR